jgi:hypothetical protein
MCHFYGKKGHTCNVCRSKNAHQHDKPKSTSYYHKCKKQGHQAHECRTKTTEHQDLKVTAITARSMDIEPLNVDQSLCGHQINQQRL